MGRGRVPPRGRPHGQLTGREKGPLGTSEGMHPPTVGRSEAGSPTLGANPRPLRRRHGHGRVAPRAHPPNAEPCSPGAHEGGSSLGRRQRRTAGHGIPKKPRGGGRWMRGSEPQPRVRGFFLWGGCVWGGNREKMRRESTDREKASPGPMYAALPTRARDRPRGTGRSRRNGRSSSTEPKGTDQTQRAAIFNREGRDGADGPGIPTGPKSADQDPRARGREFSTGRT
jgi:hypothetical protein